MDAVVRCHTLSDSELRSVFDLHTKRMNTLLADKRYFASLRVQATRYYVDSVILGSRGIEYGARAITPAIKEM